MHPFGVTHTDGVRAPAGDELWAPAAARIHSALGWQLRPLGSLGRARPDQHVWLAQAERGQVVVKASSHRFAAERAGWAARALPELGARGYPVPPVMWHGPLDERWYLRVQARLPGEPLDALAAHMLDALLALSVLREEQQELRIWDRVTCAVLDSPACARPG